MELTVREVRGPGADGEWVRQNRNAAREYMTHNTAVIDAQAQRAWLERTDRPALYVFEQNGERVAHGLIRVDGNKSWLTGIVAEQRRGRGVGRAVFDWLTRHAPTEEVWLDVLATNERAFGLYRSMGYVTQSMHDGVIVMKWVGEPLPQ